MTKSEWLPLATSVLVMLLSPLWTTWVSPRISAANLDELLGKAVRLFTQIVSSPFVLPPLNVVFNSWLIYKYLHVSDSVTKKLVFGVSTSVGLIVFSTLQGFIAWFSANQLEVMRGLQRIVAAQNEILGNLVELSGSGSDIHKDVQKTIEDLQQSQEATKRLFEELLTKKQTSKPFSRNRSAKQS